MHRPTRDEVDACFGRRLRDVLAPGLTGVLCGINPSLYSVAIGHHFGRPGNRFWPALHGAGITPDLWPPTRDADLPSVGYGITNMCWRATARADQLDDAEHVRGRRALARKMTKHRPRCLAVLGISSYRLAFGVKASRKVAVGPQDRTLSGVPLYVLPNPSGLNAHYQLPDLVAAYRDFREWAERQ